jgi:hypothetical protein
VDLAEIDGRLCAVTRGCAEVATVEEEDLGARAWPEGGGAGPTSEGSAPPRIESRLLHELELPAAFDVTVYDPARDYTNNTQRAQRHARIEHVQDAAHLQAPIVMPADGARRSAERLLYHAWLERSAFSFSLPPRYLALAPASPVLLPVEGALQRVRVISLEMGLPGELRCGGVLDGDWILVQEAAGDDTTSFDPDAPDEPDLPPGGPSLDFQYPTNSMYLGGV